MMKPEGNVLDISNVKLVLCDYDDTACIHIHLGKSRPTHSQYLLACAQRLEDYYINICPCIPNLSLKWFLSNYLKDADTRILTCSKEEGLIDARYTFLRKYYDNMFSIVHIVPKREQKLDLAIKLCEQIEIPRNEALLIEDHPTTLHEFSEEGFLKISTGEISALYLEHLMNLKECVTRC